MEEALRLARKGQRWVSPNPMVGAVVVRGGAVVARGFHRRFGAPHAEVEALAQLEGDLPDVTLYVNLEPCCHYGKTPPCADLILRRKVGHVVVGALDPNPRVRGRGVQMLREGGVQVRVGLLEPACRDLNRTFYHWMSHGVPWVTLKWAQSLDGRIATSSGHSRWISSEGSRRVAHALRATHDAVMVGVNTVLADDPRLTVRRVRGRDPVRVVLDRELRVPLEAEVVRGGAGKPFTWVACGREADPGKAHVLESRGIRVIRCGERHRDGVELLPLLQQMGRSEISSILVEGGAKVHTSFLRAGLAQRLVCFVAPIVLGKGVEAVEDLGILRVDRAVQLRSWKVRRCGEGDLMVDALLA
jgi:diaminohydroxyphosphoribosylaminopyrimidine deaminase / 5-amino-6-(5-phosphoribosylamino)uracil reductase